jgi:chromosome segregation protein
MKLARIELFGFKSFADKQVFDFSSGITAILGPNGCGKSNVVDAVKWVLGEQNPRNLRGDEMGDVIFAGSEQRRPMGLAEVTLVFDNSDGLLPTEFNEVAVSRRLYRSGESEYLLNRQRCRLRDIKELFLDTGIGTTAYSFIEQGKVEALLAAKPHERRTVFEEAAGISKYKARRKEALSRLERTEQYLLRANDIVEEVEKRIRSVSRQASNARRFQRLSEELRSTRGYLYAAQWERDSQRLAETREQIDKLAELRREEETRAGFVNNVLSDLQQQEQAAEERIEGVREHLQGIQQEATRLESEKARGEERLSALAREAEEAADRAAALRERLAGDEEERAAAEASCNELAAAVADLEERLARAQETSAASQAAIAEAEAEQEEHHRREEALAEARQSLAADEARLESEAESLAGQEETLTARRRELQDRREQIDATAAELTQEETRLRTAAEETAAALQSARQAIEESRAAAEALAGDLSETHRRASGVESRLQTLRELESSMDGMYRGVRAVLKGHQAGEAPCRDVEGVVADLVRAPAEAALAIETALGAAQQNVVTKTARGARDAIEYLKRERAGRATFLPLDRIQPRRRLQPDLCRQPGVVGEAIDLVEFDPAFRPAAEYLLAGILVVESLDRALELRDGAGRGVRMVTLEGDQVHTSGAMTGGRETHQKGGLVTRKAEVESLAAQQQQLAAAVEDLTRRRDAALARVAECNRQAQETEATLAERQEAHREVQGRLAMIGTERERAETDGRELETALAECRRRAEEAGRRRSDLGARREALQKQNAELMAAREAFAPRLAELRSAAARDGEALTALKVQHAETAQQLAALRQRQETLAAGMQERTAQAERDDTRSRNAREERAALQKRLEALAEELGGVLSQRQNAEEDATRCREQLGNLRAELESHRAEERAIRKRLSDVGENLNRLKLQEQECSIRLEGLTQKVREELEVEDVDAFVQQLRARAESDTSDEAADAEGDAEELGEPALGEAEDELEMPEPDAEIDLSDAEALAAHAEELQEKIRRLGPVNHAAIEELAELKARRDFLTSQQEDLAAAQEDLASLLTRLNRECRRRFDETFNTVRENFQVLFQRLFGGGKADLILEETEDPLNAGIEIIARPPGKEPTSISLLSGGEKALCAVALLFALFRTKPSPFCILDEVDGPLDESNIDRYMSTLEEFARESQFIIITHSKRTMSMVETIYGVTQSEPGVSKKMSLRFAERENEVRPAEGEEAPELAPVAAGA